MAPKLIITKCPMCNAAQNPIPAEMGDKTFKCCNCGRYIRYEWRKNEVKITERPKRTSSSGLAF